MVKNTVGNQPEHVTEFSKIIAPDIAETCGTAAFDEAAKGQWREQTRENIQTIVLNPDQVLVRVVAMAAIDYVLNGGDKSKDYFEPLIKEANLTTVGGKPAMPAATLATRLNRLDTENGKEAGKMLDTIASGIEGLVIAIGSGFSWAYSEVCVAALLKKVEEVGGLRKLADLARNENIDDNPRGVIRLDGKLARGIVHRRIANLLGDISASSFALAAVHNGTTSVVPHISFSVDDVAMALENHDIGESRAQVLHELTQATVAITRDDTGVAKVHDEDPKDKKTAKRLTEPHIIFRSDKTVVISAHFASGASNVVRITGMPSPFENWPDYDVMLPPDVHRKLALNLAKASQRNVVQISEEAPEPGTKFADRTWHVRSEAALHPNYQLGGPGLLFSPRTPTYGQRGEVRDTVHVVRDDRVFTDVTEFVCDFDPMSFLTGIVTASERLKRAASTRKGVSLAIKDGTFTVVASKENVLVASANGSMDKIHVSAADFLNMLLLLDVLRPAKLSLALDEQKAALRWAFRSSRATYEVFMPAATDAGTRLGSAFQPISIKARPAA